VADFRDPWVESGAAAPGGRFRQGLERALERYVVRRADRLTVTTPYLKADFLARYPDQTPDKVQVIYNGYDEEDFQGLPDWSQADRFEIVHAGLVTREFRDPFPLFRTIAALVADGTIARSDVAVTFLGGGAWARSDGFVQGVAALGLDGIVQVRRQLPHREAQAYLSRSAVLLLIQASDDTRSLIPAKAFEYLRIDRPILALTPPGATADLVKGMDHCYVVNPVDELHLRRVVTDLHALWRRSPGSLRVSRPIERFARRRLAAELAIVFGDISRPRRSTVTGR
jgi:glycosyltransferase involved in cell wall biosynthesis